MSGSKVAVGAAIGGNALVMVGKFVAFALTGSGAILSEAIHTLADLLNQVLLMVGIVRSERAADDRFEYGYGRTRFVWALISGVGIFFLGCGVTVYHGVSAFLHPHPLENLSWAIGVLLLSLAIEGTVLVIAFRQLRKEAAGRPFLAFVRTEADPTAVAVLLEDFVACLGVVVALGGILLSRLTGSPRWDAAGSIVIGLMLGWVAVWLIRRNQAILVGPAIPKKVRDRIQEILQARPGVRKVIALKSKVIDTHTWDVMASVEFDGRHLSRGIAPEVDRDQLGERVVRALGDEIDEIEKAVLAEFPQVKHLDIEPH